MFEKCWKIEGMKIFHERKSFIRFFQCSSQIISQFKSSQKIEKLCVTDGWEADWIKM